MFDREKHRVSVAPIGEAGAFLKAQHPPEPPLTPEATEATRRQVEAAVRQGWEEVHVDPARVRKAMEEQRGRLGRMLAWLDMAPVPPEKGRGV